MTIVNKRVGNLELLRMICIFFVVGIHLKNNFYIEGDSVLFNEISRIAVPTFFMLSAYFYAGKADIKRVLKLFGYFSFFMLFYYMYNMMLESADIAIQGRPGFLWFILALAMMQLVTLYQNKYYLIALMIISSSYISINNIVDISYKDPEKFIQYLPWFCLIILLKQSGVLSRIKKSTIISLVVCSIAVFLSLVVNMQNVNVANFVGLIFFMGYLFVPDIRNRSIYSYSQGVYYFHEIIISILLFMGLKHYPTSELESISLFVHVVFVYVVCILINMLLRKVPYVSRYI